MPFRVMLGRDHNKRLTVRVEGEEVKPATWGELAKRGWPDENWMKDRIQRNWADSRGRGVVRPAHAFLNDREGWPWGDQSYARYGLTPVRMVQRCVGSRVLRDETQPYAAVVDTWINHSDHPAQFGGSMKAELTDTLEDNWSAEASAGIETTVSVEVGGDVYGGKVGVSQSTSLSTTLGKGGSKSKSNTVGSEASVSQEIPPHTGAESRVNASKGTLVIQCDYACWLEGHIWLDFGRRQEVGRRGSHYFFFEDVKAHIGNAKHFQETIPYDFYTSRTIVLVSIPDPYDMDAAASPAQG